MNQHNRQKAFCDSMRKLGGLSVRDTQRSLFVSDKAIYDEDGGSYPAVTEQIRLWHDGGYKADLIYQAKTDKRNAEEALGNCLILIPKTLEDGAGLGGLFGPMMLEEDPRYGEGRPLACVKRIAKDGSY